MMLVLYGPTVTGKTDLAIKIAKKYNAELISADSRQVYKGLDIGSGKVTINSDVEKHNNFWLIDGIKIWGYDAAKVNSNWTAADFIKFANKKIKNIQNLKKLPVVVGGTGFYIKTLMYGIDTFGIPANYTLRKKLENLSVEELEQKLKKLDPDKYSKLNESDIKNPRRLIRSMEISMSGIENTKTKINNGALVLGLTAPNKYLFKRADTWLETRLKLGFKSEVEQLINFGAKKQWLLSLGLEYKWMVKVVTGELEQDSAILKLKSEIHNLIRRQKTYFKQFTQIKIFDITENKWENKLENTLRQCYTQFNG